MKLMHFAGIAMLACLATDAAAAAPASKSIVDPKYRKKATEQDWVGKLIAESATKMKDKTTKVPVEGSDPPTTTDVITQVPDGVDVDGLFKLAGANSLEVSKFEAQREHPGFPGRFRMTVANMLRAAARNRHGIFNLAGEWQDAPADWLATTNPRPPGEPTHNKDGSKIVKPKPVAAPAEPAAA